MRAVRSFAVAALVFLFLAEAQRAFFPSLLDVAGDAAAPPLSPWRLLLAVTPLLALLVPLLPLRRWLERGGAVAVSAAGVAIFRLPMSHPDVATRLGGSALVLAFAGLFLAWGVGRLDARGVAAGAATGLVADGLLRVAGGGADVSLTPGWVPAQVALSLMLLALAGASARAVDPPAGVRGLERRAGGVRRRGALALGLILFLDLYVLGAPAAVVARSGAPFAFSAMTVAVGGGVALAGLLGWPGTAGRRWVAVGLAGVVAAGLLSGGAGWAGAAALAAGHAAALSLIGRVLEPARGRRSGAATSLGLALFVGVAGAYRLSSAPGAPLAAGSIAAGWLLGGVAVALVLLLLVLPHGASARPLARPAPALAAVAGPPLVAALLLWGWPGVAVGSALPVEERRQPPQPRDDEPGNLIRALTSSVRRLNSRVERPGRALARLDIGPGPGHRL